mgnify:FL=1
MAESLSFAGVTNSASPPSSPFCYLHCAVIFSRLVASLFEHFLQDGTGVPSNSITVMFDSPSFLTALQYPQRDKTYPNRPPIWVKGVCFSREKLLEFLLTVCYYPLKSVLIDAFFLMGQRSGVHQRCKHMSVCYSFFVHSTIILPYIRSWTGST